MPQIPDEKFKEFLLRDGLISEAEFETAVDEAERQGKSAADILIAQNVITREYWFDLLADYLGVELAKLTAEKIDERALQLLPEDLARQKRAIIFNREPDGTLDVALEDPNDLTTINFLSYYLKSNLRLFLASPEDLNLGFLYYGRRLVYDFKKIIEENIKKTLKAKIYGKEEKESAIELPIVAIVDNILSYALASRASDIHIEIMENEVLLRYRIDGMLHEILKIPKEVHPSIIARIKLLANLKLDEHNKPQDGRFRHKIGADLVDVRTAIMPTFYGEKAELRLLLASQQPVSLETLGFFDDTKEILLKNIKRTYGIVLVTGPTGAGKTTTLYTILNILNRPEVNIVTIEDPIEYDIKYINQTQVNPQAGITFANGLRAILRQDPNIIMVGEIRDEETAEISVHAALTGHLVLSSLHTNDALTAIPRLIDMKIPSFLVAAVLNAILAQRLVRQLCQECRVAYQPEAEILENIKNQFEELKLDFRESKLPKVLYQARGCAACSQTGYHGRLGIFEIIDVNSEIRKNIVRPDFTLDFLREVVRQQGFVSMFEDGLRKAEKGLTTLEEVLRVIGE